MGNRKPRVFISHASVDAWVAEQIETHIRTCGADTFLDSVHIDHGDDFDDKIIDAAGDATELLVLFTPAARDRKYIWLEIGMFLVARKRVVAVLYGLTLDDLTADQTTPAALKRFDAVELNQIGKYFAQLKDRVVQWEAGHGRT